MQSLKTVLSNIKITDEDKYLSQEFQQYGLYLAGKLEDMAHKALYIKMAKKTPRETLAAALSFVLDANARSKARLFMWKVKQLVDTKPKKTL
jgi:hypothetical protein